MGGWIVEIPRDELFDTDSEQVILTDIFLAEKMGGRQRIGEMLNTLREQDFGRELYQSIFQVIRKLYNDNEPITLANVWSILKTQLGYDCSIALKEMLRQANITTEIEWQQRCQQVGILEAVKRPAGHATEYIPRLGIAKQKRALISILMDIMSTVVNEEPARVLMGRLRKLYQKSKPSGGLRLWQVNQASNQSAESTS